eukprot:6268328-Amphidinium_carterae.2
MSADGAHVRWAIACVTRARLSEHIEMHFDRVFAKPTQKNQSMTAKWKCSHEHWWGTFCCHAVASNILISKHNWFFLMKSCDNVAPQLVATFPETKCQSSPPEAGAIDTTASASANHIGIRCCLVRLEAASSCLLPGIATQVAESHALDNDTYKLLNDA